MINSKFQLGKHSDMQFGNKFARHKDVYQYNSLLLIRCVQYECEPEPRRNNR